MIFLTYSFSSLYVDMDANEVCNIFQELVQGFDQETAAVVVARLASFKMETEVNIQFRHFQAQTLEFSIRHLPNLLITVNYAFSGGV